MRNHNQNLKTDQSFADDSQRHRTTLGNIILTKLDIESYLHRTGIQRAMVHHHFGEKIQFKRSHDAKICLFFFLLQHNEAKSQ